MSCITDVVAPVFFVRWQMPEEADIAKIEKDVAIAHARVGKALCFVGIVPENTPVPSAGMRGMMIATMDDMLVKCATMHVVIEGHGFRNSLLRSVAAGVLQVSSRRGRCFVHATLDEALAVALKSRSGDVSRIRLTARARHLVV